MGILNKLKSIFTKLPEKAPVELVEAPQSIVPEPKGEIIGRCTACLNAIGSEDRVKELNGATLHKRCFKKAKNDLLAGKSMEEITKGFVEGHK